MTNEDYVPSAVPAISGVPLTQLVKYVTYFAAAVALLGTPLHLSDSWRKHPILWDKIFK
jgi:hypothetical protein